MEEIVPIHPLQEAGVFLFQPLGCLLTGSGTPQFPSLWRHLSGGVLFVSEALASPMSPDRQQLLEDKPKIASLHVGCWVNLPNSRLGG